MLTDYLADATIQERAAELRRCQLAAEVARLNRPPGAQGRWFARWFQLRTSRSRRAASTSGHSLSTME